MGGGDVVLMGVRRGSSSQGGEVVAVGAVILIFSNVMHCEQIHIIIYFHQDIPYDNLVYGLHKNSLTNLSKGHNSKNK